MSELPAWILRKFCRKTMPMNAFDCLWPVKMVDNSFSRDYYYTWIVSVVWRYASHFLWFVALWPSEQKPLSPGNCAMKGLKSSWSHVPQSSFHLCCEELLLKRLFYSLASTLLCNRLFPNYPWHYTRQIHRLQRVIH